MSDPVREALQNLLGHWDEFVSRGGFGNQEDAFYCLAKGAQQHWAEARAALAAPSAVEELCAALNECAAELSEWVENHYKATKGYVSETRRYNRDMEPVRKARTLITKYGAAP